MSPMMRLGDVMLLAALHACWIAARSNGCCPFSSVLESFECLVSQCPACACLGGLVLRCLSSLASVRSLSSSLQIRSGSELGAALHACWIAARSNGCCPFSSVLESFECLVNQCPACACLGGLVLRCLSSLASVRSLSSSLQIRSGSELGAALHAC